MRNRTVNAFIIAVILTACVSTLWTATTTEDDGDEAARVVAADGSPTGTAEDPAAAAPGEETRQQKKKGNRFARFFKAPFKAAAKLFGGGDDRVRRLSEKDVAKFESAPLMRVQDSRTARDEDRPDEGGAAKDYLARGRAMLGQGRLNEAVKELSRAVSLDPRLSEAHNLLAVAYERKGLHDRARESFERAVDTGADAQTLNNLGYSFYLSGNYRAAVARLKRAARLAPSDERILNNLALAQCRLGKYDDAYKSFARSGGEYQGRLNVAAMLERAGREDQAIEHYEAARRVQPESEFVLRRLAELYTRNGYGERAEQTRRALAGRAGEQVAGKE